MVASSTRVSPFGSWLSSSSNSPGEVIPGEKSEKASLIDTRVYITRLRQEGESLRQKDERNGDVPVSFSAIGLNSSGLRYESWSVSRELKRKRPSAPRIFRLSSYWGTHASLIGSIWQHGIDVDCIA